MLKQCNYKTMIILFVFILGLIYYVNNNTNKPKSFENFEGLTNKMKNYKCPNLLIKKGKKLFLENTNLEKVPGVNPIEFNNLEEYKSFLEWQKSQGIKCPVLFLEQSQNAQGELAYKTYTSIFNPPGNGKPFNGLHPNPPPSINFPSNDGNIDSSLLYDAGRNDPPYNKGSYPGVDTKNQYVGLDVPLDHMRKPNFVKNKSEDAFDKFEFNDKMNQKIEDRFNETLNTVTNNDVNTALDAPIDKLFNQGTNENIEPFIGKSNTNIFF